MNAVGASERHCMLYVNRRKGPGLDGKGGNVIVLYSTHTPASLCHGLSPPADCILDPNRVCTEVASRQSYTAFWSCAPIVFVLSYKQDHRL